MFCAPAGHARFVTKLFWQYRPCAGGVLLDMRYRPSLMFRSNGSRTARSTLCNAFLSRVPPSARSNVLRPCRTCHGTQIRHQVVPRFVTKLFWQHSPCAGDMLLDMPYRPSAMFSSNRNRTACLTLFVMHFYHMYHSAREAIFCTPAGHAMVPRFVTKLFWQHSPCAGDMLLDMPYRPSAMFSSNRNRTACLTLLVMHFYHMYHSVREAMFCAPAGHAMVSRFVTKLFWQYRLCEGDMLL